jgi:glycine cleavage system pyridoxal-binding protein P
VVEDVAAAAELAHGVGARMLVTFDPLTAGVLEPPGRLGADIVVGEGQGLGNHPNFGGPAFGFLACRSEDVRRLPGRLVGETVYAADRLAAVPGVRLAFGDQPFVKEFVVRLPADPAEVCRRLADHGLLAGLPLAGLAPGLEDGLLVAVTERRTKEDVDRLADALARVLADLGAGRPPEGRRQGEGVAR